MLFLIAALLSNTSAFFCALHCTEHMHDCVESDGGKTKNFANCNFNYGLCMNKCGDIKTALETPASSETNPESCEISCANASKSCGNTPDCTTAHTKCSKGCWPASIESTLKTALSGSSLSESTLKAALAGSPLSGKYSGSGKGKYSGLTIEMDFFEPGFCTVKMTGAPNGTVDCKKTPWNSASGNSASIDVDFERACPGQLANAAITVISLTFDSNSDTLLAKTTVCDFACWSVDVPMHKSSLEIKNSLVSRLLNA